uniref:Transmembrane protein n=1 Tax=Heterorhabditis bacteriophora TaxID=37862 RepID=A0A1I7WK67_HETBA
MQIIQINYAHVTKTLKPKNYCQSKNFCKEMSAFMLQKTSLSIVNVILFRRKLLFFLVVRRKLSDNIRQKSDTHRHETLVALYLDCDTCVFFLIIILYLLFVYSLISISALFRMDKFYCLNYFILKNAALQRLFLFHSQQIIAGSIELIMVKLLTTKLSYFSIIPYTSIILQKVKHSNSFLFSLPTDPQHKKLQRLTTQAICFDNSDSRKRRL